MPLGCVLGGEEEGGTGSVPGIVRMLKHASGGCLTRFRGGDT